MIPQRPFETVRTPVVTSPTASHATVRTSPHRPARALQGSEVVRGDGSQPDGVERFDWNASFEAVR